MTFALGVPLALAAGLALMRGRWLWAAALAALCAAASPVAGVLLALAGLTVSLERGSPRALLALAVPVAAIVLALAALFPEGGYEPYPIVSFAATIAVVLAFLAALPQAARLLRIGACVYVAACVACLLVHSPMGSNVERYAVLLAGPLLLCARLVQPAERAGVSAWRRIAPLGAAAMCVIAVWVAWGPVRETVAVAGSEATSAAYYKPVERFLAAQSGGPVRVEVPLTRSHWEAALLAPTVSLARGWEKQLDDALRPRAARARADGGELRALAARAGGLLRGAAGRGAGPVERPGGHADPSWACRICDWCSRVRTGASTGCSVRRRCCRAQDS